MTASQAPPYIDGLQHIGRYDEIEEILRSHTFVQGGHGPSSQFFGRSLVMVDGPEHAQRKRIESRLFTRDMIQAYSTEALRPAIRQVLAQCPRGADGLVYADLVPLTRSMLHQLAARVTGIDGVDDPESTALFIDHVTRLSEALTVEWSTGNQDDIIRDGIACRRDFVQDFFRESAARRLELTSRYQAGTISEAELPHDLLTLLFLHWSPDWDDELPLQEATLFLVGSTLTTTHALPRYVIQLLTWLTEHPQERERVGRSDFLRRAAYESLRFFTSAPAVVREAKADVRLKSGRIIAAGERVALIIAEANLDPSVYGPTSTTYDPGRDIRGQRAWGLAFGAGAHTCIGRTLITGFPSDADNLDGTMVTIARALLDAGLEVDPANPPLRTKASYHDTYSTFPVVLTAF